MTDMAFDSLEAARKLRSAGVGQAEAEATASVIASAVGSGNLVTKDYLAKLLSQMETRMMNRFYAMSAAQIAIIVGLVKLL